LQLEKADLEHQCHQLSIALQVANNRVFSAEAEVYQVNEQCINCARAFEDFRFESNEQHEELKRRIRQLELSRVRAEQRTLHFEENSLTKRVAFLEVLSCTFCKRRIF
jgi:hypothetical protein